MLPLKDNLKKILDINKTPGHLYTEEDVNMNYFLLQLGETPTYTGLMFFLFFGVYALSAPGVGWIGDKTVS